MAALRGAAEVEQVGVVDDQGSVDSQLFQRLLKSLNARVNFTFRRVEHVRHEFLPCAWVLKQSAGLIAKFPATVFKKNGSVNGKSVQWIASLKMGGGEG